MDTTRFTLPLPPTGNFLLDGILWGGNRLDNTITYSFWDDSSLDDNIDILENDNIDQIDTPWSDGEKAALEQALAVWSNVANITFVEVDENVTDADFKLILLEEREAPGAWRGRFEPPQTTQGAGIGYFNQVLIRGVVK